MKILFIGGAGFIGANLVKRFCENGSFEVTVIEPETASIMRLDGLQVEIVRVSLANVEAVEQIIANKRIDTVVHLVSTLIPGSGYEDFKQELTDMVFPSIRIMEYCARFDIKFVYFSSGGTVYGNRTTMQPFVETDDMAPISYYGWSKQMMENSILFKNRTERLRYLIVRPSNPYGHGQNLYGRQGLVICGQICYRIVGYCRFGGSGAFPSLSTSCCLQGALLCPLSLILVRKGGLSWSHFPSLSRLGSWSSA